jgi:DNA polymerase-1
VHDELIVECPEGDVPLVSAILEETMEGAGALSVPLTVEIGVGRNWAEAK